MRAFLSLIGLLLVVLVVMKLTGTQLAALPTATTSRAVPAAHSGAGESPSPPAAPITQQVPDAIRSAVDAGMAARASDAER